MLLELATASATAEAIARPELERLLLDVAQGLRVCGVLKGEVKPKDIADMADNVWKRADGPAANGGTGATTSLPVAKLWALCQNDFSKHGLIFAMLRGDFRATMRVVRNSGEFVKKGPKKLDADSSSDRFKRARATASASGRRAFGVNRDGKVDFDEFVIGMARFMPTDDVAAQLAYIFSLYDVNRDGNVELWEVTDVLEDHEDDLGNMYEHCLKVNWKLDLNGDGKITMGEFFKVMGSEKIYINYCWNSLPPLHPAIAAATATLVACFRAKEHDATDTPRGAVQAGTERGRHPRVDRRLPGVRLDGGRGRGDLRRARLQVARRGPGRGRGRRGAVAPRSARTVAGAIGAVFAIVERDRDSPVAPVDPRGVWAAVGKALCVTYVDKSRILYKLIDDDADDDDTSIKLEEVTRYIHNVKDRYAKLVGYTIDHFDDLDADHDGVVTQQELVDKVLHDPRLLQLFSLIFFF
ncbi:calcineurin subunit B type 2 [Aureococcus anophagefferens]|nr:calcineurin subunit B type 2 [Aureococcus anophagefferens]